MPKQDTDAAHRHNHTALPGLPQSQAVPAVVDALEKLLEGARNGHHGEVD